MLCIKTSISLGTVVITAVVILVGSDRIAHVEIKNQIQYRHQGDGSRDSLSLYTIYVAANNYT